MPDWSLELAAEDLRQASPEAWSRFINALQDTMAQAFDRVLAAGDDDALRTAASDTRALHLLLRRLRGARETAARVKEKK